MTVRLTAAQARAAGLDVKAKTRATRRTVKGQPYLTVCSTCGFESRTIAAEDRHLAETKHARFGLVLGL